MLRLILILQGAFYVTTGIWPLLHIGSFMAVTGPKEDVWLVHAVGVLVLVVGVVLVVSGARGEVAREVVLLAIGCALGLAAIEVVYVARGVIAPIYLADAVVEVVIALLIVAGVSVRREAAPAMASRRRTRAS